MERIEARIRKESRRRALAASLCLAVAALVAACGPEQGATPAGQSGPRTDRPHAAPGHEIAAFVGVTVVPMDRERLLENQTVLVSEGHISGIGPAGTVVVPPDAMRIDGRGRYLMPGLAEMHAHIPGGGDRRYAEDVLYLYVANGVTTIRGMAGDPLHLELRERTASGELIGPTIFAAAPGLSGQNAGTPEDAERAVRERVQDGYDLLKVFEMPVDSYRQMARTAGELGIGFAGHVPEAVGLVGALEAGQASIDHLDRYVEFLAPDYRNIPGRQPGLFGSGVVDLADTSRIAEAVQRTVRAGTWNVPTLSLVEQLASPEHPEQMIQRPEMLYMPTETLERWVRAKKDYQAREDFQPEAAARLVEIRRRLVKALHDGGAPIALGSDSPQFFNVPGFSIHHELAMMAAAGLTPYEALVTGTRNPAAYFGTPEAFGTVEVGRRADLILLEANPLDEVANVQQRAGVMLRGRWLPEPLIQERLSKVADAAAR